MRAFTYVVVKEVFVGRPLGEDKPLLQPVDRLCALGHPADDVGAAVDKRGPLGEVDKPTAHVINDLT